jgi:parallel beta-helix repeat protein
MPHRTTRPSVTAVTSSARSESGPKVIRLGVVLVASSLLAALLALLLVISAPGVDAAPVCDKYAATNGSDGARGTSTAPYRTAQKLVNSLSSGQVGCLRGGTYNEGSDLTIKRDGITLRSAPNQRAVIRGRVYLPAGTDRVTVRNLTLEGTAGKVNVLIRGNYNRFIGNNITNYNRSASCMLVGSRSNGTAVATGTEIQGNRIHNCGRGVYDHGIYLSAGRSTKITGNRIYNNTGRGIQLYPDSQGAVIRNNAIDGNGWGVVFGGTSSYASSNNLVENNAITNSKRGWNIYGSWASSRIGKGNVARNNCVWASSSNSWYNRYDGVQSPARGFSSSGNRSSLC